MYMTMNMTISGLWWWLLPLLLLSLLLLLLLSLLSSLLFAAAAVRAPCYEGLQAKRDVWEERV